jgi:hypothetical protein
VSTKNKWALKLRHQPVIAGRLRITNGYVDKSGVVVIVNEHGEIWQTIAGHSDDGALMWLLAGNPDL